MRSCGSVGRCSALRSRTDRLPAPYWLTERSSTSRQTSLSRIRATTKQFVSIANTSRHHLIIPAHRNKVAAMAITAASKSDAPILGEEPCLVTARFSSTGVQKRGP